MTVDLIQPENVYALVVGIEKYKGGSEWDLNGPANDALKFANWLLERGVEPDHIQLFLSPLDRNVGLIQAAKAMGLTRKTATHDLIAETIRSQLTSQNGRGDLLYVFWGGHGNITKTQSTIRRMLFADTDNDTKWNLNFNSLLESLSTFAHGAGFRQQIFFVDTCANALYQSLFQTVQAEAAGIEFAASAGGEVDKGNQFVLFASAEYETATNESDLGTGSFSRAVLEELQGKPLMLDAKKFVERVKVNLRDRQRLEPIYWSYEYAGNKEAIYKKNTGVSKSDSVSPTATSQLQVPDELESKLQELLLLEGSTLISNDLLASLIQALKLISGIENFEKIVLPAFIKTLPDFDMDSDALPLREQLCNSDLSDPAKWLILLNLFLNNWGRNSAGQLYIVLFVQNLKNVIEGAVQTALTQWLNDLPESVRPVSQVLEQKEQKIYPERPSDEALKKLQAYLLIIVEPVVTSGSNKYMVNGYVITRLGNEQLFSTIDEISLHLPPQESPYYTLEQIENGIPKWIIQVMNWIDIRRDDITEDYDLEFSLPKLPNILTVEFWLPLDQLTVAVESWKIYSLGYQNFELGRVLGEVYSVIVRSFDRFYDQESFDRLEENLEDLVSHSQKTVDVSSTIIPNLHLDDLTDKDKLKQHLNKPCLSLSLTCPLCTADYMSQRKDLFNLILEKGIPLVLWSRSVDLTDVQKAAFKQRMEKLLMDNTFNQLEQLFKEVKKERTENNKLAIWCDEPERLKQLKKFRNLKQRRLRA